MSIVRKCTQYSTTGMFKGQKIDLFRKFTRKSLQVKQMNKILLENDKTHYMNIRNIEP